MRNVVNQSIAPLGFLGGGFKSLSRLRCVDTFRRAIGLLLCFFSSAPPFMEFVEFCPGLNFSILLSFSLSSPLCLHRLLSNQGTRKKKKKRLCCKVMLNGGCLYYCRISFPVPFTGRWRWRGTRRGREGVLARLIPNRQALGGSGYGCRYQDREAIVSR